MWNKLTIDTAELNLNTVLQCGQSFRWRLIKDKQTDSDVWSMCLQNRILLMKQDKDQILYRSIGPGNDVSDSELVKNYFNLDIKVKDLYAHWKQQDSQFQRKSDFSGIRILRQEPWETLCAFICSSNNNIKRISKMVMSLTTEFGPYVASLNDNKFYDFPSPEALAKPGVEEKLRELGFGYRAKYIASTAKILNAKKAGFLHSLRPLDTAATTSALLEFPGVGPKVADCVSLMSLDKHSIVPIDTHMYKIAARDYKMNISQGTKGYTIVQNKFKELWGDYAGWAHSVLFTADLSNLELNPGTKPRSTTKSNSKAKTKIEVEETSGDKLVVNSIHVKERESTNLAKEPEETSNAIKNRKSIKREVSILDTETSVVSSTLVDSTSDSLPIPGNDAIGIAIPAKRIKRERKLRHTLKTNKS